MNIPAKVLIVGSKGQLGRALCASIPKGVTVLAVDLDELDITDREAVESCLAKFQPELVINAAAYTQVDKAESEVAAAEAGNVTGPRNLAVALSATSAARLIHISTDFVFDGGQSTPYLPDDTPKPVGVYGKTKLAGEQAVRDALGARALIVRTAWVYDAVARNFMRTMLRLMKEQGAVRVVADQIGTPTCTHSLAAVLWSFARQPELSGVYHWTDAGVASWYDFAMAIAEEAVAFGLLQTMPKVQPIATHEYPTPARRPMYSVLDKAATHTALGIPPVHWRVRLREVMAQMKL